MSLLSIFPSNVADVTARSGRDVISMGALVDQCKGNAHAVSSLFRRLQETRSQRLFLTLIDQGVVSAGSFLVQLTLARKLPPTNFGVFVLIFSALFTLQLCNATLIFHPMSVRIPAATDQQRAALLGASSIMLAILSGGLALVLVLVMIAMHHAALAAPALVCFAAWQTQEGLRRGLLSDFRYSSALVGDALSYMGQAGAVMGLGILGLLTVRSALFAIAACAVVGAVAHAFRLTILFPSKAQFQAILADYWAIGGLASLGNGFLATARTFVLPWALAALSGPAVAGNYQAATNIVNLSNPLILGLGNVLPQAAASASSNGHLHAWHTVRGYVLLATPPIMLYSVILLLAPTQALMLFYGTASPYVGLDMPLRLLVCVGLVSFATEAVLWFLHGLALVRRAALINLAGTAVSLTLIIPLVEVFGLPGGCIVLLLAAVMRLFLAYSALHRVIAAVAPGG